MSNDPATPSRRLLDPIDRIAEILFGLIMVLTFTGSLSIAESNHAEIRTMLIGAVGCNLAWGFIDSVMYLMIRLIEHGRSILILRAVRQAADSERAHRIIANALPPVVASISSVEDLEKIRQKLRQLPEPPAKPRLSKRQFLEAFMVFLAVFSTTFPVVIPFIFMHDAQLALRVSNGIAIVMLFLAGFSLGRYAGYAPWRLGVAMVLVGSALVAITVALGG